MNKGTSSRGMQLKQEVANKSIYTFKMIHSNVKLKEIKKGW